MILSSIRFLLFLVICFSIVAGLFAQRIDIKPVEYELNPDTVFNFTPNKVIKYDFNSLPKLKKTNSEKQLTDIPKPLIEDISFKRTNNNKPKIFKFNSDTVEIEFPEWEEINEPVFKDDAIRYIKYLDAVQGLNSSYIRDIILDERGYMWFATNGVGLSRYNGSYIQTFTEKNGLANMRVYDLLEDRDGNIWIATYGGGINIFNGKEMINISTKHGLPNNFVLELEEGSDGNIYAALEGGSIVYLNKNKITVHRFLDEKVSIIDDLLYDSKGILWIATDIGFYSLKDSLLSEYYFNELEISASYYVFEDSKKITWISTDKGILKTDASNFWIFNPDNILDNYPVYEILENEKGELYFASYGNGVLKKSKNNLVHYTKKQGMTLDYHYSLCTDKSGNIWVGSDGGGVSIIYPNLFEFFQKDINFYTDYVMDIVEDEKGRLWFATYGDGVVIMDSDYYYQLYSKELPSNTLVSIESDKEGNIWTSTADGQGIYRISEDKIEVFSDKSGLKDNYVSTITIDKDKTVWLGDYRKGFSKIKDDTLFNFNPSGILTNHDIRAITVDNNNNKWLVTDGQGILKINQKTAYHYNKESGLPDNFFNTVFTGYDSIVWFGSLKSGLFFLKGDDFYKLMSNYDYEEYPIYSIIEDTYENMWIGTEKGLIVFSKNSFISEESVEMIYLDHKDGLKSADFQINSVFRDNKGDIWFGTGKNLTKLNMQVFVDWILKKSTPDLDILSIQLDDETPFFTEDKKAYEKYNYENIIPWFNLPDKLKISSEIRRITFKFSAIEWFNPYDLEYSYRVIGLDNKWNTVDNTQVELIDPEYGDFTFQVRVKDATGTWSQPVSFSYEVLTPWYVSWWAILFYIISFLILIGLYINYRNKQIKMRRIELEEEVSKATRKLNKTNSELKVLNSRISKQKDELKDALENLEKTQNKLVETEKMASLGVMSAGIAHEINNPLNYIKGGSFSLRQMIEEENLKTL